MKRLAAVAAAAVLAAALSSSRWALRHRAPCANPDGAPVKLELALAEPAAKIGKRYALWTKVVLTNVSCDDVGPLDARAFYDSRDEIGLKYTVRDSAGAEVPAASPIWGGKTEYGRVIPYSDDTEAFGRLQARLGMNDDGFVVLKPGDALVTAASTLDPHENLGWGPTPGPDGSFQEGMQVKKSSSGGIDPPPAGFRSLDRYVFKKPGRYTIRAVVDRPETRRSPRYPYAARVPSPLKRMLNALGLMGPGDSDHTYFDAKEFHLHAESGAVEFEVRP